MPCCSLPTLLHITGCRLQATASSAQHGRGSALSKHQDAAPPQGTGTSSAGLQELGAGSPGERTGHGRHQAKEGQAEGQWDSCGRKETSMATVGLRQVTTLFPMVI